MGMGGSSKSRVAMAEINVTPLVDVMLVLLIIFMVTAPMMQQGIQVELPATANSGADITDKPFMLVIKKNEKLYVGDQTIPMSDLKTKLEALFKTRQNKQLYLQADKAVNYGLVAEAMGEIRAAGIYNISLITMSK